MSKPKISWSERHLEQSTADGEGARAVACVGERRAYIFRQSLRHQRFRETGTSGTSDTIALESNRHSGALVDLEEV